MKIKTHKNDGDVGLRPIHDSTGHPSSALQQVIQEILRPHVTQLPCKVHSTDEVQQVIENVGQLPEKYCMYKMDIKDFYLMGKHEDIESVASFIDTPKVK